MEIVEKLPINNIHPIVEQGMKEYNFNSFYYLNNDYHDMDHDNLSEFIDYLAMECIRNKEQVIIDYLVDAVSILTNDEYIYGISVDDLDYESRGVTLWSWLKTKEYYYKSISLEDIEFNDIFFKEFNLTDDYETIEALELIFGKILRNINLLFELSGNYEDKLLRYYKGLNMHYLGIINEDLERYYLRFIRGLNMRFEFRGYGLLFDGAYEHIRENYEYDFIDDDYLKYYYHEFIEYLKGGL